MISFPDLAEAVSKLGEKGKSLAALAQSSISASLVGILASRVNFKVRERVEYEDFDLFICEDSPTARLPLRSPFGIVCLDPRDTFNVPRTHGVVLDALEEHRLYGKPVLLFYPHALGDWSKQLSLLPKRFVVFSTGQLVDVLVAHPPRTVLIDRVLAHTPLRELNPYTFRGPIGGSLFVGRVKELEKLCKLDHSYTLVGPRTIGKTSLMYRAYETLRSRGELAIRMEFSPALTEEDLHDQIVTALINDYGVAPTFQTRTSIPKTERFLARFARRFPQKRAAILMDEADGFVARCPRLAGTMRALHNTGAARFVFVGFKELRKAANDAKNSPLMNICEDLPLSGLSFPDCGGLVLVPMAAMGVSVEQPEKVVDIIFRETGGAPSRVQLLCSALVETMDQRNVRSFGPAEANEALQLPAVQAVFRTWYRDSTSTLEKQLAGLASAHLPCPTKELAAKIMAIIPEWTEQEIMTELDELLITDVLTQNDGRLAFSFPALREIVRPVNDTKASVHETRHLIRQSRLTAL